ncbi:MAG: AAA domain-containing protein [Bacteroidales bacterium]|nr:AAA domain-containing protein [Bacteroidales bacterium]
MIKKENNTSILSLLKHQQLLKKEYEYEKASYIEQNRAVGIDKRIKQGKCWYPLNIKRSFYNSLNQLAVEIERTSNIGEEHEFETGKPVCFFNCGMGGVFQFLNFSGTVNFVDEDRMIVSLPNESSLQKIMSLSDPGLQIYFDEISYQAMFKAVSDVLEAKNNRLSYLRDTFIGNNPPTFRNEFPISFPWLNSSQENAVRKVLEAKDVAVVHGPPGTGKTTTLVEAIYETLHRESQVLVCAQSNAAVDWISEKLMERGVNVLRIGNPMRINDKLLDSCYERRFESHPDYSELWSIRKAIREIKSQARRRDNKNENLRDKLHKLQNRQTELEIKIDADIFSEARVISSTLIGSSNRVLSHKHFSTLFIDEAAQALEAACWVAIEKSDRVILAGDHFQLPPTIKCFEAQKEGLGDTLMEKIVVSKPQTVSLLTLQYRMHQDIMSFSSKWFYEGKLHAAPEVLKRDTLSLDFPMVWYNTEFNDYKEEVKSNSLSRFNCGEAQMLIKVLKEYIERNGEERIKNERIDFGIISPYKAQVYYLRSLIKKDASLRRLKSQISINSVDGFQGQERDVILISMVRGNDDGKIGFLNDLRRMNVAITRARLKLIILGDASTLSHNKFYKSLYEHIDKYGKII